MIFRYFLLFASFGLTRLVTDGQHQQQQQEEQPQQDTIDGSTALTDQHQAGFPCYNQASQPQRCVPEFVNAAFNRRVNVTNTCGEYRPIEFCVQSGHSGMIKDCDICDARIPSRSHSAVYLTDFNNPENETWWQSETMNEQIQYPNRVNLTLNLGKAFDITYVRLKFHSPRPESFAIYKKTRANDSWVPWQFYSATCRTTYGVPEKAPILYNAETVAQCASDYSDISPLTGADIAFSTLEGRPSAHNFENSPVLQDWVTATEIRIVLDRLNTFGDEVFRDDKVLRSYYYAISDFAVGGRCKCNGHASECVKSTGVGEERLVCRCEHFTMGEDCERCMPFYNDRPWRPATAEDANECRVCDCNGLSTRCYFDEHMFANTGSGGHCIDCAGNTRGPHCERCLENYWRRQGDKVCTACNCNEIGSLTQQCNDEGKCICKPGVTGQYCDRCQHGYYDFSIHGCKDCGCVDSGSYNNQPSCRSDTGECSCKQNVEGKRCDRCKPGYFNLDSNNEFGCTPCFCHGHSSICDSAQGYYKANLTSDFTRSAENWKIEGPSKRKIDAQYNDRDKNIAATEFGGVTYFSAPEKFLNNQRHSYNQYLSFKLRVVDRNGRASVRDIVLQGANGQTISLPIFAQNNQPPDMFEQTYRYRLHEDPTFQWTPRLSSLEFISLLSNLSSIKIRATYSSGDAGFLDDFSLGSAAPVPSSFNGNGGGSNAAKWVETCTCPEGFVGQNCESCAPGYRRDPKHGGPFARCIKCECHNHADYCEAESGRCICQHKTAGDTCERCARGFFGNALKGTVDDCQPCPCPSQGPCILHTDNDVICLECTQGYAGRRCDICADGYYGDPKNNVECKSCECSGNIDPNSIGNCDRVTGECKKCIHNTHGFHCENCSPGFYGDALLEPKGDCKRCSCNPLGTYKPRSDYKVLECSQSNGQCQCLSHVTGRTCDACETGYYNISSGTGCHSCNCDPLGSVGVDCDLHSGQCRCKPGVTGKRCDQCQAVHYGFGVNGCQACDCFTIGSLTNQCDITSGQCPCKTTVEGRRCDRCMENKYNLQAGCLDCDQCYTLIQRRVNQHRAKLGKLKDLLKDILENPTVVNDTNFENKLKEVMKNVESMSDMVTNKVSAEDGDMASHVQHLRKVLGETDLVLRQVDETLQNTENSNERTKHVLLRWDQIKNDAQDKLNRAQQYLQIEGQEAWAKAKTAADTYGQQSALLTSIAEEARKLASKHKNDSTKIEENAHKALNASRQAEKGAIEAVYGGQATSQEIIRLKHQYNSVDDLFNQTEQIAKEQKERAENLHQEAAAVLNKVDALKVPILDTLKITKEAADISEGAKDAKEQAEKLALENKGITEDSKRLTNDAEHQLKRATKQQQTADSLLTELDAARAKGQEAIETAENTLTDASKTLKTLNEFDALVEKSRGEAVEAMEKVSLIEKTISDAENKTLTAEKALGTATSEASSAEKIANNAQTVADGASLEAMKVRQEAYETKFSAENLKGEAGKVQQETVDKAQVVNNYKTNANQDKVKAQSALTEASAADNTARKANETAEAAMETLKRILEELNSLDGVNDDELDRLGLLIDEASKKLEDAKLEENVETLKNLQAEQNKKINFYKAEIDKLTNEVKNIGQIEASLPDKCFNVVDIEGNRRR